MAADAAPCGVDAEFATCVGVVIMRMESALGDAEFLSRRHLFVPGPTGVGA